MSPQLEKNYFIPPLLCVGLIVTAMDIIALLYKKEERATLLNLNFMREVCTSPPHNDFYIVSRDILLNTVINPS